MNTLIMPAAAARFNHVIAFDVSKASLSLHILPSGGRRPLLCKTTAPPSGAC